MVGEVSMYSCKGGDNNNSSRSPVTSLETDVR